MSIFSGLTGNVSEVDIEKLKDEYSKILAENERLERAYKLVRDLFIFTSKRIILVDKQGMTAKKIEYHSIPYKNVRHYSIESSGHFDLDAQLKIWVAGLNNPIAKKFNKKCNIYDVQKTLSEYVL